jgi:hypothetical protein
MRCIFKLSTSIFGFGRASPWKRRGSTEFCCNVSIYPQGWKELIPYQLKSFLQLVWIVCKCYHAIYHLGVQLILGSHPNISRWRCACLETACILQSRLLDLTHMVSKVSRWTHLHPKFLLWLINRIKADGGAYFI